MRNLTLQRLSQCNKRLNTHSNSTRSPNYKLTPTPQLMLNPRLQKSKSRTNNTVVVLRLLSGRQTTKTTRALAVSRQIKSCIKKIKCHLPSSYKNSCSANRSKCPLSSNFKDKMKWRSKKPSMRSLRSRNLIQVWVSKSSQTKKEQMKNLLSQIASQKSVNWISTSKKAKRILSRF